MLHCLFFIIIHELKYLKGLISKESVVFSFTLIILILLAKLSIPITTIGSLLSTLSICLESDNKSNIILKLFARIST